MAITFSEQFRAQLGGRKWILGQATHDESATTLSVGLCDLQYVDFFQPSLTYVASEPANLSTMVKWHSVSINATHDTFTWGAALATGSKTSMLIIGW